MCCTISSLKQTFYLLSIAPFIKNTQYCVKRFMANMLKKFLEFLFPLLFKGEKSFSHHSLINKRRQNKEPFP